jgi:hypothetical protein
MAKGLGSSDPSLWLLL